MSTTAAPSPTSDTQEPVNLLRRLARRVIPEPVRTMRHRIQRAVMQTEPRGRAWGVYWRRRDDAMSTVHQLAHRLATAGRRRSRIMTLLWPVAVVRLGALLAFGQHGRLARTRGAGPAVRQLWQLWWLAMRNHITPHSYYKLELYRTDRRRQVNQYLQHHEIVALMPYVKVPNRLAWFDKRNLEGLCRAAHIPCIPIVANVSEGRFQFAEGRDRLPREDLFVKVDNLWGGLGAICWRYDGTTDLWQSSEGMTADERRLIDWLQAYAADRSIVVQPRVRNHPHLARWSNGALCTVRVVTFWRGGAVQHVAACLRMPVGDSVVDNLAAGGMAAWIDPDGRLSGAVNKSTRRFDAHPDTGSPICGQLLPDWDAVRSLASRAHVKAAYPGFVGWDIAVTERGALLVEVNKTPCVEVIQMPAGQSMGSLGFGESFLALLEHPEVAAAIKANGDKSRE